MSFDGTSKTHLVHALVAAAFIGPRPDGLQVCHFNGDKTDNRPSNLRYDTASANQRDTIRYGMNAQARKTHCLHGHAFDEANTYWFRGTRICRACSKARARARYRARVKALGEAS